MTNAAPATKFLTLELGLALKQANATNAIDKKYNPRISPWGKENGNTPWQTTPRNTAEVKVPANSVINKAHLDSRLIEDAIIQAERAISVNSAPPTIRE